MTKDSHSLQVGEHGGQIPEILIWKQGACWWIDDWPGQNCELFGCAVEGLSDDEVELAGVVGWNTDHDGILPE